MKEQIQFSKISQSDVSALSKKAQSLGLKPEQIQAAHYFALPKAYRPTQLEIASELGVTQATIWAWQKNSRVQSLSRELMKRYFFNDLPDILEAMKVKALQGSESAARLVIEYIEDFMGTKNSTVNITQNNVYISKKDVELRIAQLRNKIS